MVRTHSIDQSDRSGNFELCIVMHMIRYDMIRLDYKLDYNHDDDGDDDKWIMINE